MDKDTRNKIQKATQAIRRLLEVEFAEQLEGTFDIRRDGSVAERAGAHLSAEQRLVRDKLVAAVKHRQVAGGSSAEAVQSWLREAAFTTLNRFVALKMLEARGLVQECVSNGDQSGGFKEFSGLAPGLVALPDKGYRLYIECLFDEIGREVKVLFDRQDPASLLWPRRAALTEVLERLNAEELAAVWGEDETIGWVYQYFNGEDERKKMREESQAPRNSRELAVRNQFFTPRYVVQFLTDNTLGRMWYDMHQGQTKLKDLDYLVRRPTEVFLSDLYPREPSDPPWREAARRGDFSQVPDEPSRDDADFLGGLINGYEVGSDRGFADRGVYERWLSTVLQAHERDGTLPDDPVELLLALFLLWRIQRDPYGPQYAITLPLVKKLGEVSRREDLSREEALKAPFFVPKRDYKDPRELKVLDPACGSGHFLLYAFDLLLVIYEEAFEKKRLPGFDDLAALRKALPELILRHNLHGVDIDPRAAQIAALALWMRAQRAWKAFGVERKDRPTITRTHIVVAEPMPGDKTLVDEFAATLKPSVLGELFKTMVDKMTLAGELGSLLKIEEHLASAIDKAKKAWLARKHEKASFLPGFAPGARQAELELDTISDEGFFAEAEGRILAALSDYASSASGALGVRRRLFAEDAAQGVAFIELMRQRFDVVLMNPPFGAGSARSKNAFEQAYERARIDLYAAFVERGVRSVGCRGLVGAITSRTGFFLTSFAKWRDDVLFGAAQPTVVADLGAGVLDSAMVEVAAYCLEKTAA